MPLRKQSFIVLTIIIIIIIMKKNKAFPVISSPI